MPPEVVKFDAGTAHFGDPICPGHPGYDARTMSDTLDLPELLTEVIAEVQAEAEDRGVHVTASHVATMPRWVEADEAGLRRILHNALDFVVGAATGGTVTVHLDPQDTDHNRWTCVVEWQDVRCAFGLTLPLARDRAMERPLRILIVDDSAQQRAMVAGYLAGTPHVITEAAGGTEAINQVQVAARDVVLLDWQMPHMDGAATCRALREHEAGDGLRRTFIVALTGMGDDTGEATETGADACLPKPVSRAALVDVLGRVPVAEVAQVAPPATWTGLPASQLLAVARHQLSMILAAAPGTQLERLRLFGHHLKGATTDALLTDIAFLAGALEDEAESGVLTRALTAARTLQAWMARAGAEHGRCPPRSAECRAHRVVQRAPCIAIRRNQVKMTGPLHGPHRRPCSRCTQERVRLCARHDRVCGADDEVNRHGRHQQHRGRLRVPLGDGVHGAPQQRHDGGSTPRR